MPAIAGGIGFHLNAPMRDLTGRPDPHRAYSWLIHYGDVHVGTIFQCASHSPRGRSIVILLIYYDSRCADRGRPVPMTNTGRDGAFRRRRGGFRTGFFFRSVLSPGVSWRAR